jgi:hypothetical protein
MIPWQMNDMLHVEKIVRDVNMSGVGTQNQEQNPCRNYRSCTLQRGVKQKAKGYICLI